MNIMNKLYKCALGLLTTFILSFASFSNAIELPGRADTRSDLVGTAQFGSVNGDSVCFFSKNSSCNNMTITAGDMVVSGNPYNQLLCALMFGENIRPQFTNNNNNNVCTVYYFRFNAEDINPKLTSLQCQTEYNLIPIEEVTANYCRLNFDLIDPQECPINSGTGAIVRSNLMINDIPYAQNQNINVFIPDFLNWNIAFNDFNTTIEVEGYNADEEYIENVINQEKLTPTNKDIEQMLTGFMTNYFPHLALAIVFLYLARKIFKLFK